MEDNNYLIDYYNQGLEDGRLTSRVGSVEFLTTMRYIEKYLKPGDRIIEIGAGTGRYSHALAQQGYAVDAVELIESNIKIFKDNTQLGENITITQGNALDLSKFSDETYDVVLLFGPMYHLYTENDKKTALSEAIRIAKSGGIIIVAYVISDACVVLDGFVNKSWDIFEFMEKGMVDSETFKTHSKPEDLFELVRKDDIDNIMKDFTVTRLHYVATNGITGFISGAVEKMDEAMFELYLKYHYSVCEREDMVGVTHHSLDIFKKE